MNFGVTGEAAPNAASSSVARYSRAVRTALSLSLLSGFQSLLGTDRCLLASAAIKLASTAKASPPTIPSFMQRGTTVSNSLRSRDRSPRKRPWRFLGKRRMIGDVGVEPQATEPAIGQIEMDLLAQPTLGTNAEAIADNQHPDHQLRINRGRPHVAIVGPKVQPQPSQINEPIDLAYRKEPNVSADSNVETYVAMRFEIDNWRWAGVPFYVRTGKHMAQRTTEIAIRFKQAPYSAFQDTPVDSLRPNWLVLGIAPSQGISLQFEVKRPGSVLDLAAVKMDFRYDDWFPKEPNVGYETLIHDVMIGDQTLFMRADMVEQAWRIVQPVLDAWTTEKAGVPNYDSGGDGPAAADELLARDGERIWRPVTTSLEQTS